MTVLGDAIEAANLRKEAGLAEPTAGELYHTDEADGRGVISGFDIDYDEFTHVVAMAGSFFTQKACESEPLIPLFRACWVDAFLVGLMVRKNVAPHHDPPGSNSHSTQDAESGGLNNPDQEWNN